MADPDSKYTLPPGRLERWFESVKTNQKETFDLGMAIIIGLLCGFASVIFHFLIEGFSWIFWQVHDLDLSHLGVTSPWKLLLIPFIGGALVGPIIYYFAREAKGHGVPEVMAAVTLKGGIIRGRVSIAKAVASAITIASGGSAGREGPIIQIGSALGSTLGQTFKVSNNRLRTYIGCGAAGGIAATFNAPIAGALFSVEVIMREFGVSQFSPIVISSVLATTVSRLTFGDDPIFHVPHYELVNPFVEFGPYIFLGVICALVSVLFTRLLYASEDFFDERLAFIPEWFRPAIGGLFLGVLGCFSLHEVFGDGKEAINLALLSEYSIPILLLLLVGKIAATSFTLGSGGSGGVFAPSLFLGAFTGSIIGQLVSHFFEGTVGSPGGYALVAMGGVVAGTTHAPITAMLIIFEITDNYSIILPLMIVCIVSTVVSTWISHESIYTLKLLRKGYNLYERQSLNLLNDSYVMEEFDENIIRFPGTTPASEVLSRMIVSDDVQFYVVNDADKYEGVILLEDIRRLLINREGLEHVLLADDLAKEDVPTCHPGDELSICLQKFEQSGLTELPVVDSETGSLMGVIRHRNVLARYNSELIKREPGDALVRKIIHRHSHHHVKIIEGFSMVDWEPPAFLWGKTLAEARLGERYDIHAILVKKKFYSGASPKPTVPNRRYVIEANDVLVIYGSDAAIERVQNL